MEVRREAAADITLLTPVAEGDPLKAGEPTGLVPGGRGAKGDTVAKPNKRKAKKSLSGANPADVKSGPTARRHHKELT